MNKLKNDRSFIEPENIKNASEGAGQLFASIGKELDEHDVVGKVGNAYAFSQKAGSIAVILIVIVMIIFMINFGIRSANSFKNENTSRIEMQEGDSKRIIVENGVKEYQIKDENGFWYRVDENIYKTK